MCKLSFSFFTATTSPGDIQRSYDASSDLEGPVFSTPYESQHDDRMLVHEDYVVDAGAGNTRTRGRYAR